MTWADWVGISLAFAATFMGIYTFAVMGEPSSLWLMQSLGLM